MLVEIVIVVLVVGAFVGGILVYRNNKAKADAAIKAAQDAFNTAKDKVKK